MKFISISKEPAEELLHAQTHVWNHALSYLNSMALRCAIELGIPDAIQKHGSPMTLGELAKELSIHPNKAPSLPRIMHPLVHSNFFSKHILVTGEEAFDLTINSRLLTKNHPFTLAPFALLALDPITIEPTFYFSSWFQSGDDSPFRITHEQNIWEFIECAPKYNMLFNEAMVRDSQFVASLLMANNELRGLFDGLESLVDVGGGNGTMAKAIAKVFPDLTCIVFDLPHVIKGLNGYGKNLKFVGGNMFESIPPAQAVLLKLILHDWSDEHCIKILQLCKEAIPSKRQGGKVIIIDMVLEMNNDTQFLFDLEMMNLTTGGKERTKEQWKKLFINAGFKNYKIFPMLGSRSVIEVYP